MTCLTTLSFAGEANSALSSWCQSGNPKTISRNCEQYIIRTIGLSRIDDEKLTQHIENKELAAIAHAASFFRHICPRNQYIIKPFKDRGFVDFFLKNPDILKGLAFSNKGSQFTLDLLYQIWLSENKNLQGIDLKMALGAALSISDEEQMEDRLARYRFYKQSNENGSLFEQTGKLHPWEMAILFSLNRSIEDLSWGQAHTANKKNYTAQRAGDTACSFIPYRSKNKDGISVHKGAAFYDNKPQTLAIYVEYGGVCGAVSTAACGFIGAKGIPAYTVGQPGHCAFIWKALDGNWKIGNNIYGWVWTDSRNLSPWTGHSYMMAAVGKFQSYSTADQSWLCYELSTFTRDPGNRKYLLEQAVKLSKWNLPAWNDLLGIRAQTTDMAGKTVLVKEVAKMFKEEPIVVKKLVEEGMGVRPDKNNALKLAALMLGESTSRESNDMYMMALARQAETIVPSLQDKLKYTVESRKGYLGKLVEPDEKGKLPGQVKRQTCDLLEKALPDLQDNPNMQDNLLSAYIHQMEQWNDPKYHERGLTYLKQQLQNAGKGSLVYSRLSEAGAQLAKLAGLEKEILYFTKQTETSTP